MLVLSSRTENFDKKIQILEACAGLLSKKGLQSFSYENLAHASGMSRQLIRYYYASLDEIIVDLCDYLGAKYQEILISGIVELQSVERLNLFLDFFFGLADEYPLPDHLEAYDAMIAYSVGLDRLRDRMCDRYRTLGQVMVHELAIAYPELKPAACEELSFIFVSLMHAHWSFVASLGYSSDHNRLARRAMARLIESYRRDSSDVPMINRPWLRGS
jgi:AcrR family transcriptional regulator